MIDYSEAKKRFEELGIKPYSLKSVKVNGKSFMAQSTFYKVWNNDGEHMSTQTIEELCQLFQCQPKDILANWTVELDPTKSFTALVEASKKEKAEAKEEKKKARQETKINE